MLFWQYFRITVMSWSWSNPSQDEALEAYQYYKSKYYSAVNQKSASEKQERNYRSQKNSATSEMNSLSSQKTNFEKRLKGIEDIIKMLEGNGGGFSTNVPNSIAKAQKSLSKTSESYRSSIRLSGGVSAASLDAALQQILLKATCTLHRHCRLSNQRKKDWSRKLQVLSHE